MPFIFVDVFPTFAVCISLAPFHLPWVAVATIPKGGWLSSLFFSFLLCVVCLYFFF